MSDKSMYEDLVNTIKDSLEADSEKGVIKPKEGSNPYVDSLPEGLTKKVVKEVEKYQADYVAAATIAATEMAGDILAENKSLEAVKAEVPFAVGRGSMEVRVDRERSFRNPQTGEVSSQPYISTKVKFAGAKPSNSLLKDLRAELTKKI